MLSRATTIYDLLTRAGVSWRVYESEPSVTMLRMFARYATNITDIVPFSRLQADVATGNLPAFTAIEPAMHHHPQDDDHPDADMYRGQIFLQKVYEALRSNPAVWRKTLLLITYDEHGGFYDHVVPPVADVLFPPGIGGHPGLSAAGGAQQTMRRRPPGDEDPPPPPGGGGEDPPLPSPRPAPPRPPPAPPQTRERVYVRYGVRVPTFVVSPWVTRGKGPSLVLDHCSILKTVLARFCSGSKPFLSDRVSASQSFEAFLGEAQPRLDIPPSPTLGSLPIEQRFAPPSASQIVTPPMSRKQLREGDADFHQISGWLARMLGR